MQTLYGSTSWTGSQMNYAGSVVSQSTNRYEYSYTRHVSKDMTKRNWRKILASGGNATTDMSGWDHFKLRTTPGQLYRRVIFRDPALQVFNSSAMVSGEILRISPSDVAAIGSAPDQVHAMNRSLTNLYSNISSVETYMKGMVTAGELPKTLEMIRSPAKTLRKGIDDYLSALRRRVPRRASNRRKLKVVADTYLEYAFGWKPTISDIDSAVKAFYKSRLTRPIFQMVTGQGQDSVIGDPLNTSDMYGPFAWFLTFERVGRVSVKHYGIYHSRGQGVPDIHSYGFNPEEFIPTLWELIPGSFVADYFTNLGDIISSWSYRRLGLSWCSRTVRTENSLRLIDFRVPKSADDSDKYYLYEINGGSLDASNVSFARTASVPLELPTLELEAPGYGSVKWLNLAALAASLASTRRAISSP